MKKLTFAAMALTALAAHAQKTVGTLVDPLAASAWQQSAWISVTDAPVITGRVDDGRRAADGASWFVCQFKNSKKVKSAKWMTTGLGTYELYVNRQLIGDEILKPGFTHWGKTKRSFTYDVTKAIKSGAGQENELAVQVTPGWWADKIITPGGHDGMIGLKVAFRGVLELTYADGSTELLGSNQQDWKAGIAGPVKHAAIFDGEDYDARSPQGYEEQAGFRQPELNSEFRGEILPNNGAEIYLRTDLALSPKKAYTWQGTTGANDAQYGKVNITQEFAAGKPMTIHKGETLVVDFGQNASAVPFFDFKAATPGTTLTCLPAELLNDGNGAKSRGMDGPEGSCHRLNLRIPDTGMILRYTFDGAGKFVKFHPQSTFFGYRFVSITATDEVTIRSIQSVPVTSITKDMEIGTIQTGSEDINKLISNTIWGQRSNYLSVTTDCPQRNERLGWTADTQVFTETGTFFASTDRFFHKWTKDMRDTQSPTGAFPGVAPLAQYGAGDGQGHGEMMRLGWADAGIIVPWTVWKQFGDKAIVEENWDAMTRFMNHIYETKYEHTAMTDENGNYQWADWLSYEPLESCGGGAFDNGPKPEAIVYWNYLSASYWCIDAGMMRDMAKATGRNAAPYEQMVKEAKAYIREKFLKADGSFLLDILNTMQTPALFALRNEVVEGQAKNNMIARLRENFKAHDNCLQTGFLGTSILMQTLTDNGMQDIAYELLFQHKNPSWLYSIDNGATTIWERWNSYMLDTGMGPRGMNSFNHYAYGCVCEWLWETAAGIASDPAVPGFRHIIMKPIPDKRLGFVKAEYKSAAGLIKSSWKYDGDKWTWRFTIPKGATATVTFPGQTESREYGAGTYSYSSTTITR